MNQTTTPTTLDGLFSVIGPLDITADGLFSLDDFVFDDTSAQIQSEETHASA